MKKLAATALAAALALPVLFTSSDAAAYERHPSTRIAIQASVHRPAPHPVAQPRHRPSRTGQWQWQQVVTQAPDRVERVRVEVCKPRGHSHRPPKCHTTFEHRVVPGERSVTWQWVWVDRHDRRVVRAW